MAFTERAEMGVVFGTGVDDRQRVGSHDVAIRAVKGERAWVVDGEATILSASRNGDAVGWREARLEIHADNDRLFGVKSVCRIARNSI